MRVILASLLIFGQVLAEVIEMQLAKDRIVRMKNRQPELLEVDPESP